MTEAFWLRAATYYADKRLGVVDTRDGESFEGELFLYADSGLIAVTHLETGHVALIPEREIVAARILAQKENGDG